MPGDVEETKKSLPASLNPIFKSTLPFSPKLEIGFPVFASSAKRKLLADINIRLSLPFSQ